MGLAPLRQGGGGVKDAAAGRMRPAARVRPTGWVAYGTPARACLHSQRRMLAKVTVALNEVAVLS